MILDGSSKKPLRQNNDWTISSVTKSRREKSSHQLGFRTHFIPLPVSGIGVGSRVGLQKLSLTMIDGDDYSSKNI